MDAAPAPQHMRALNRANEVRLARAELKKKIADGTLTVAAVLEDQPWEAARMTVADLLMSQHRWGHTRCRRFLAALPMSETKTVVTLTDRQREQLIARLAGRPTVDPFAPRYAAPFALA
jgi:hypothetical protein